MPYVGRLVGTAALLVVAYAPLWRVVIPRLGDAVDPHATWKLRLLTAGYNAYALVVSESVAPWFWRFGVPATVGIAAGFTLALVFLRGETRRWFIFGAVLLAGMDVLGLLQAKWLFLVAPWFLLPIAVLFGTMKHPYWRAALALSLAIPAAIGWYGVYSRHYYSQQRFLEPWASISVQAVQAIHDGGFIIGDNPSFFFYLTYALPAPPANSSWRFSGSLPEAVHHPQVWSPSDWQAAGQPIAALHAVGSRHAEHGGRTVHGGGRASTRPPLRRPRGPLSGARHGQWMEGAPVSRHQHFLAHRNPAVCLRPGRRCGAARRLRAPGKISMTPIVARH